MTITTADATEKNFTARAITYSIYGVITEMGSSDPMPDVELSLYQGMTLLDSTVTGSDGSYSFGGLSNGMYTLTIDSGCVPAFGMMSAYIFCASVERNFECRGGLGESKRQEAASRLKKFSPIDNHPPKANNSDMDATADKDNPSAISHQPSARTEASVAEYLFYHCDHLGTVRLITDNSGAVVSRHDYEPFGVEIAPVVETANNTHRFTGHERDANTGYDYMHYRSYGSNLGRFMKPDNITGNPLNPQSWNLYSYVRGNPVNFNDPTGHLPARDNTTAGTAESGIAKDNGQPAYMVLGGPDIANADPRNSYAVRFFKALEHVNKIASGEISREGSVIFDPSFQKALSKDKRMREGFAAWLASDSGGNMFSNFANDANTTFTYKGEKVPGNKAAKGWTNVTSNDLPVAAIGGAYTTWVDVREIEIFIAPQDGFCSAHDYAETFLEEALHAESISSGWEFNHYSGVRSLLDPEGSLGANGPISTRYWKINYQIKDILKSVGRILPCWK